MGELVKVGQYEYYKIPGNDIFTEFEKYFQLKFKPEWITGHHTAGTYTPNAHDSAYQILIHSDYILIAKDINDRDFSHTWHRNSNNIGIGIMAMAGATQINYGKYPITNKQVEIYSKVLAIIKKITGLFWSQFVDHYYWCIRDKYISLHHKWDLQVETSKGDIVQEISIIKAKWYFIKYLKGSN